MNTKITENTLEMATLDWLAGMGYETLFGPDIAPDPDFLRMGLINGRQLVDLPIVLWSDIPEEFQELLGLKKGLVRS